ncbi:MAG: carboxymuconolactone decarboxylase family protein [candidate division Zixibacteria bacterium]|nr:carboxymuconolactone decarboxylase family protein [candidate division Zixibacteria bacterium]
MNLSFDADKFREALRRFGPGENSTTRSLSVYSAAVATAEEEFLDAAVERCRRYAVNREQFYEIILQSYLFLGFPRMLTAAKHLNRVFPGKDAASCLRKISPDESECWFEHGMRLCKTVYGGNYELLKERMESIAPEIFRWMIIEGYGKVLSRPLLSAVDRELAVVACLMVENRPKQLHAHMRGALNVGASLALLSAVVHDIGGAAGEGFRASLAILDELSDD